MSVDSIVLEKNDWMAKLFTNRRSSRLSETRYCAKLTSDGSRSLRASITSAGGARVAPYSAYVGDCDLVECRDELAPDDSVRVRGRPALPVRRSVTHLWHRRKQRSQASRPSLKVHRALIV